MTKIGFADVLATIPMNVGNVPEESMVVILIKEGRIIANLVFVLPEHGVTARHIMSVIGSLSQVEFEHFMTVVYTEKDSACRNHPPQFHVQTAVAAAIHVLIGADCLGGGLVTKGYFLDYDEEAENLLELTKHPLIEVSESETGLHLAVDHGVDLTRKRQPAYIPEPDSASLDVRLRIDNIAKLLPKCVEYLDIVASPHVESARAVWERCLARDFGPTQPEAIQLIAYMQETGLRDRLIVDVMVRTENEAEFTHILTGQARIPVPRARIASAIALLTNLLQYAAGRHRRNLLFALASLSWYKGESFQAIDYLEAMPKKERKKVEDADSLYGCLTSGTTALSSTTPPID